MAAWMLHAVCCGEEAGARNLVFFRVKWLQPAMKGTSCVRRVRLGSFGSFYVFCNNGCCLCSMCFLKLWLQIALEWLHECCMPCVVGRKPEHETLCFSVCSGCSRRWEVPCVCGGCGGWGRLVPSMCFATMVVPVCVVLCVSWSCGCRSHWNGCMNVACCVLWGGSRSTKPCVFPCAVAAAGDERYLVCVRRVRLGSFGSFYVFCNNGCSCVSSSIRFLTLWLQIALEWLHECCMPCVVGRKPEHETLCFSV